MAEHVALLRYCVEHKGPPLWEERVRRGDWLREARQAGVTAEGLRRYDPEHQKWQETPAAAIFRAAENHNYEHSACPALWQLEHSIRESVERGQVQEVEGRTLLTFLGEIAAIEPRPESFEWSLNRAVEECHRQALVATISQAGAAVLQDPDRARRILSDLPTVNNQEPIVSLRLDAKERWDRYVKTRDEGWDGIPTGIRGLDDQIGGAEPGDLGLIMGRTSAGKSWLATFIAWQALLQGRLAVIYAGEIAKSAYLNRLEGLSLGIDPVLIRCAALKTPELEARYKGMLEHWSNGAADLGDVHVVPMVRAGRVRDLYDALRAVEDRCRKRVDTLIVDPAETLAVSKGWEDVLEVFDDLKRLALRESLVVWAPHQMNRPDYSGGTKDLGGKSRYSDAIPDKADWSLELFNEDGILTVKVTKTRSTGETGKDISFNVDYKHGIFREVVSADAVWE